LASASFVDRAVAEQAEKLSASFDYLPADRRGWNLVAFGEVGDR
jgi:hypothetical protein